MQTQTYSQTVNPGPGALPYTPCESCGTMTEPRPFRGRTRYAHTCPHGLPCPAGLRKHQKGTGCPHCASGAPSASYVPPPPPPPPTVNVPPPAAPKAAPKRAPKAAATVDPEIARGLALQALADLENLLVMREVPPAQEAEFEKQFTRYQSVKARALTEAAAAASASQAACTANETAAAVRLALIAAIKLAV